MSNEISEVNDYFSIANENENIAPVNKKNNSFSIENYRKSFNSTPKSYVRLKNPPANLKLRSEYTPIRFKMNTNRTEDLKVYKKRNLSEMRSTTIKKADVYSVRNIKKAYNANSTKGMTMRSYISMEKQKRMNLYINHLTSSTDKSSAIKLKNQVQDNVNNKDNDKLNNTVSFQDKNIRFNDENLFTKKNSSEYEYKKENIFDANNIKDSLTNYINLNNELSFRLKNSEMKKIEYLKLIHDKEEKMMHVTLSMAEEIEDLHEMISQLSSQLLKTLDENKILKDQFVKVVQEAEEERVKNDQMSSHLNMKINLVF